MPLAEKTFTLRDGKRARLRVMEPPFDDPEGRVFWWPSMRERWLRGGFAQQCFDRVFAAEVDGELAGAITLMKPREAASDVGAVEFVWTREDMRGNGIATFLLRQALAAFRSEGGLALFLCTTNPAAGRVYRAVGFRPLVGDGMRWLAQGAEDFDDIYFSRGGPASVREANRGDLARFVALYNWPRHACFIKERSCGVFGDYRFESHFNGMIQAHEKGKGLLLALECPRGRVVGACCLSEGASFYEQHVAAMDFLVASPYGDQTADLLRAAVAKAPERGWSLVLSERAHGDEGKETALVQLGFATVAEIPAYFRDGENERSLRIWCLRLSPSAPATRPRSDYYGGLPQFLAKKDQ